MPTFNFKSRRWPLVLLLIVGIARVNGAGDMDHDAQMRKAMERKAQEMELERMNQKKKRQKEAELLAMVGVTEDRGKKSDTSDACLGNNVFELARIVFQDFSPLFPILI